VDAIKALSVAHLIGTSIGLAGNRRKNFENLNTATAAYDTKKTSHKNTKMPILVVNESSLAIRPIMTGARAIVAAMMMGGQRLIR